MRSCLHGTPLPDNPKYSGKDVCSICKGLPTIEARLVEELRQLGNVDPEAEIDPLDKAVVDFDTTPVDKVFMDTWRRAQRIHR